MTTPPRKTQSALRAALKQEDAALAERLPAAAAKPARKAAGRPQAVAPAAEAKPVPPVTAAPAAAPAAKAKKPAAPKPTARRPAAAKTVPAPAAAAKVVEPAKAAKAAKPARASKAAAPAKRVAAVKAVKAVPAVKAQPAAPAVEAARKDKREKVVRDSFSMPKSEHAQLKTLRTELAKAGRICTKSELLRAGLQLLLGTSTEALVKRIEALPVVPKGKGKK